MLTTNTIHDHPRPRITLPPMEVDVVGSVNADPRCHPARVARVSAETARANAVAQAQWVDAEVIPRAALRSLHLYAAAALLCVAALALAMKGQPSETHAKVADALNVQDAVAEAILAAAARK